MADLRCSQCGGPLTLTKGQHVVFPTTTITYDGTREGRYGRVTEVQDNGWCGPCLAEWDRRMGAGAGA